VTVEGKLILEKVLDSLKVKVSEFNYNNWFKNSVWSFEAENRVRIQVPSKFVRDWILEHYFDVIKFELFKLTSREHEVIFKVVDDPQRTAAHSLSGARPLANSVSDTSAPAPINVPKEQIPNVPHNRRYTFSSYVVGNSNQFVHAACQAVAQNPARHYNPLFIYGGVGLGKTHLLHSINNEMLRHNPGLKTRYITGEEFTNEVINSIRYQKTFELRQKYRINCDLLLIDDIQFIAGKERTMEEFFHTFNALYESRKQIVMTSDVLPKDIPNLEERLRSRFSWGLLADIQPPELETRIAILKKKADEESLFVPDEVSHFIASHIKTNVRDLEGVLIRLAAMASLAQAPISLNLAREVIQKTSSQFASGLNIEAVQKMVADHFSLRIIDLKSPRRHKNLAVPRQIAMFLCKKHIKASFPEIGDKFGGKDHTTVMHACKRITNSMESDQFIRENLDYLEKAISQYH